jgi:hypothetical protein
LHGRELHGRLNAWPDGLFRMRQFVDGLPAIEQREHLFLCRI